MSIACPYRYARSGGTGRPSLSLGLVAVVLAVGCGGQGSTSAFGTGGKSGTGVTGTGTGTGSGTGTGTGGPGTGGMGMGMGMGMGTGTTGAAGAGTTCSSSQQTLVVDCGYPYSSSNPLTSVVFNESEVLRAIQPSGSASSGVVRLFYNDEHAMTLGVRSVVVTTASGSTSTNQPSGR